MRICRVRNSSVCIMCRQNYCADEYVLEYKCRNAALMFLVKENYFYVHYTVREIRTLRKSWCCVLRGRFLFTLLTLYLVCGNFPSMVNKLETSFDFGCGDVLTLHKLLLHMALNLHE